MPLVKIKNLFSFLSKKTESANNYLEAKNRLGPAFGQTNQYLKPKKNISRIKQRLLLRKIERQSIYQNSTNRTRPWLLPVLFIVAVSLSFSVFINREHIIRSLQSFALFQVSEIVVTGCKIVPQESLREASGIVLYKTSLINLNTSQLAAKLQSVPWVADAVVKRNWPSTVEISILESVPVALLHTENPQKAQFHYVDQQGVSFLPVTPGADMDFPVITGLSEVKDPHTRANSFAEVLVFIKKMRQNNPYLPAQSISEIHLNHKGEMVVYLVEYPFPIFFGNGKVKTKYSRLIHVLRVLYKKRKSRELFAQIKYIQMDYLGDKVRITQQ